MLIYVVRTDYIRQLCLKFSSDEDMRAIERKLMPYGKIDHIDYTTGYVVLIVAEGLTLDYVQETIRRMRFKKPASAASTRPTAEPLSIAVEALRRVAKQSGNASICDIATNALAAIALAQRKG